jgi:hypothetical protein
MERWAIVVGLAVGTIAVLSAAGVWVKKQLFGMGGSVLTAFGALLIGMAVWGHVRIAVTETGLEFEVLRQEVRQTAEATAIVVEEAGKLARAVDASRERVAVLTQELRRRNVLGPAALAPMLDTIASVDRTRLDSARVALDSSLRSLRQRLDAAPRARTP